VKDTSVWIEQLLLHLGRYGPQGEAAAQFILERRVKVTIHDQPTGARWTINRNIQLHPRFAGRSPDDPYPLSLIVHEVRHLEQGIFTALSVYGELDAWQLQFSFIRSLIGYYHRDEHFQEILNKLMSLNLDWDRKTLTRARELMKEYAGKAYRIDLLPLYPLPREIYFFITRKKDFMI
jgi:hypothetical protein